MAQFSSESKLDDRVESLIAAMFYKQILYYTTDNSSLKDFIMSSNHATISKESSNLIARTKCPISFYVIRGTTKSEAVKDSMQKYLLNNGFYLTPTGYEYNFRSKYFNQILERNNLINSYGKASDDSTREYLQKLLQLNKNELIETFKNLYDRNPNDDELFRPIQVEDKFLPFIPLVEGGKYFYEKNSENHIVTLKKIIYKPNTNEVDHLIICNVDKTFKKIYIENCENPTFEEHKNFLTTSPKNLNVNGEYMRPEKVGVLYNFNIYPANILSLYMSQGRTISDKINLILTESTKMQGIYVAFSRVNTPNQFSKVTIPNFREKMISVILNYPEMQNVNFKFNIDLIINRLSNTYKIYDVHEQHALIAMDIVGRYFLDSCSNRKELFEQLLNLVYMKKILNDSNEKIECLDNAYKVFFKYKDLIISLSFLNQLDCRVWVKAYSDHNDDIKQLFQESKSSCNSFVVNYLKFESLRNFTKEDLKIYIKNISLIEELGAKPKELLLQDNGDGYGVYFPSEFIKKIYTANEEGLLTLDFLQQILQHKLNDINLVFDTHPMKQPPLKKRKTDD